MMYERGRGGKRNPFAMQGNVLCWGKFLAGVSCNDRAGKALASETFDSKGAKKKKSPSHFVSILIFFKYLVSL